MIFEIVAEHKKLLNQRELCVCLPVAIAPQLKTGIPFLRFRVESQRVCDVPRFSSFSK